MLPVSTTGMPRLFLTSMRLKIGGPHWLTMPFLAVIEVIVLHLLLPDYVPQTLPCIFFNFLPIYLFIYLTDTVRQ